MDRMKQINVPTPFDVGSVNCYLIDGGRLTLIDPGPATDTAYSAIATNLERWGHDIVDIERILITHPHMDHFGLANRLASASGASVYAHTDAQYRLERPDQYFDREQDLFRPFLLSMGLPEKFVDTVVGLPEPYLDFQEPVTVDRPLGDGDIIATDVPLRAVHTPGHAPGTVCYVSTSEDMVFTGDHVLAEISPNPLLTIDPNDENKRTRSLPHYIASLHALRETGITTGYGGHGVQISDLPERIEQITEHHKDRKERIADILAEKGPMPAYHLMSELFPNLPATEMFAGMSEIIGHLDLLEAEERVSLYEVDGEGQYELIGSIDQ